MKHKYKRRTKKERQNWWKILTPEQQDRYIKNIKAKKVIKNRIQQRIKATAKKNCLTCFHYKVKCCDGVTKDYCCKYYFDAMDI